MRVRTPNDYGVKIDTDLTNVHDLYPHNYRRLSEAEYYKTKGYVAFKQMLHEEINFEKLAGKSKQVPEQLTLTWYYALIGELDLVAAMVRSGFDVLQHHLFLRMYAHMSGNQALIEYISSLKTAKIVALTHKKSA